MDTDEGSPAAGEKRSASKRHKKHRKKHKHSKDEPLPPPSTTSSPKPSIKLKLKLGSETMGTKNFTSSMPAPSHGIATIEVSDKPSSKREKGDHPEMSEEEKWLDALEKGTLNSYGEVSSSKKDPTTLTARQKALLHGSQEDKLLQLPSGYKTVELTDEQKQKRQEKAKRRRQQANEKIENDKTSTVHKLLKKQDSKNKRQGKGRGGKHTNIPRVIYRNNIAGISICLPSDTAFPMEPQAHRSYPTPKTCGVDGCTNRRTSVCSKTNVPVCGLGCYRKNLQDWKGGHQQHLVSASS